MRLQNAENRRTNFSPSREFIHGLIHLVGFIPSNWLSIAQLALPGFFSPNQKKG